MEYREIVAHLARFHRVSEEDMATFRARIHVLRKSGIPPVAKVGKGSRATFAMEDLTEMHLGLTLGEFGFTPTRIAGIMHMIRENKQWWPFTKWGDDWLIISLKANNGELGETAPGEIISAIARSEVKLVEHLKKAPPQDVATWRAVLSLAHIARDLKSVA